MINHLMENDTLNNLLTSKLDLDKIKIPKALRDKARKFVMERKAKGKEINVNLLGIKK